MTLGFSNLKLAKCTKIVNQSNSTYTFQHNILAKQTFCIEIINSKNITIDCDNKNLLGLKYNNGFFIVNSSNIIIKNCFLRNFKEGFYLNNVTNSSFVNVQFFNVQTFFHLKNTQNNKFTGNYPKNKFKFEGYNVNEYPFFDLNSFFKNYKITILFIIFANLALLLDFIYERKFKNKIDENYFYGVVLSLFFAYTGYFVIENERFRSIFYFFSIMSLFFPYLLDKFKEFLFVKEVEEMFPIFVMDLSQLAKSGMPITRAIILLSKNDYGLLTPLVKKLAVKISWGINIKQAFQDFAEESRSDVVKRVVKGLIEAHESGGNIITFLDSLINDLSILNNLQKERESIMYKKILQFYLLYFFLILTIVGLSKFVLPFVQEATKKGIEMTAIGNVNVAKQIIQPKKQYNFDSIFFFLAIVQSIFSGLIIGKMTAGTIKAGIKHLAILFPLTYIIMKLAGF